MRRMATALLLAMAAASLLTAAQAGEETKKDAEKEKEAKHSYVGVAKCRMCHKSKARGNQYGQWQETRHAQAWAVLGTDAAKEAGKKAGVDEPQKNPKCLKCHVTAYGVDEELIDPKFSTEDGVGCESCHGPGSDYVKLSVMKDREKALEAGLILPTEEVCVRCHNKASPTFTKFDFKEAFPKVAHPRPKPEEEE